MTCGAKGGDVLAFHMQRHGLRSSTPRRHWAHGRARDERPAETPQQAARRLAATAIRDGYKPEALHIYTYPTAARGIGASG